MAKTAKVVPFEKPHAQPKPSLASVLSSARVKSEKKTGTPTIDNVDQGVRELAQEIKDTKTDIENLTATLDIKGAELVTIMKPIRENWCVSREYISSVKVPCTDGMTLTIAWSSNYVKCPPENESLIIGAIGEEKYERYFKVLNTIKVKSDIPQSKLEELIGRVGADEFAEFFEVETNIRPNEKYKLDQFTEFTHAEKEQLELAGIRAYKPAIKK